MAGVAVRKTKGEGTGQQATERSLFTGDKEQYVRAMFAGIAPQYDRLNAILSFRQDRAWRRRAVRMAKAAPGNRCLDVCTGTGDFAVELASVVGERGQVIASDFCAPMIHNGLDKVRRAQAKPTSGPITMMVANAECLPYPSNAFDVVTVGFGVRNVARLDKAVSELARVARPGGRVAILEFNRPPIGAWYKPLVDFYLFQILPRIGGLLSSRDAYTYLPYSMKQFVSREELSSLMERAGLREIVVRDLNFGTVVIHLGTKPLANQS